MKTFLLAIAAVVLGVWVLSYWSGDAQHLRALQAEAKKARLQAAPPARPGAPAQSVLLSKKPSTWKGVRSVDLKVGTIKIGDTEDSVRSKIGEPREFAVPRDEGVRVELASEIVYGIRIVNDYFIDNKWFRITLQRKVPYRPYVVKWKGYNDRGIMEVSKMEEGVSEVPKATAVSSRAQPPSEASALPKFQHTGHGFNAVVLLVSKSTTKDQLVALVREFQKAKREGNFGRLIPPTTPGSRLGSYGGVQVFVMDDPKLATDDSIRKFLRGDLGSQDPFVQKFANSVRAFYFFTAISNQEVGSLGYDDGEIQGVGYKKLF